jgi:hypothetical protein
MKKHLHIFFGLFLLRFVVGARETRTAPARGGKLFGLDTFTREDTKGFSLPRQANFL